MNRKQNMSGLMIGLMASRLTCLLCWLSLAVLACSTPTHTTKPSPEIKRFWRPLMESCTVDIERNQVLCPTSAMRQAMHDGEDLYAATKLLEIELEEERKISSIDKRVANHHLRIAGERIDSLETQRWWIAGIGLGASIVSFIIGLVLGN